MGNDKAPRKQPAAVKNDAETKKGDDAPKNLGEAKLRVMTAVQYVRKRGKMGTKYNFVRDTDVIAATRGPMIENGLILTGPHEIRNRSLAEIKTGGGSAMFRTDAEILFKLKHVPSGEEEPVWVIGEGADNLDKSSNKAMSAARKYALILGFNLTSGEDPDQFDEEGRFGGGEHDEEQEHGTKSEPPAKAQNTTTVPSGNGTGKAEPKKEEQHKPVPSGLPANGEELARRLREYDSKLAAQKLGTAGALVSSVTQAGVRKGYPAELAKWSGDQIAFAVEAVKEYEAELRKPKAETTTPNKDEGKAEAKAAERAAEEKTKAEPPKAEAPKPAPAPATAAPTQPAGPTSTSTATAPTPQERYEKRIAGMGASTTKENLDKFRERYTKDADMTAAQKAELEKCYWLNVSRVTGKPLPTEPAAE